MGALVAGRTSTESHQAATSLVAMTMKYVPGATLRPNAKGEAAQRSAVAGSPHVVSSSTATFAAGDPPETESLRSAAVESVSEKTRSCASGGLAGLQGTGESSAVPSVEKAYRPAPGRTRGEAQVSYREEQSGSSRSTRRSQSSSIPLSQISAAPG